MASYDGANMFIYCDGFQENTAAKTGTLATNNESLTLGLRGGGTEPFNGIIDEVRVSSVARSADRTAAQYKSMTDDLILWTLPILNWQEIEP